MSAEATVVRNYLDWMTSIPWHEASAVSTDLDKAEKMLNQDHYGLEKVKDRILEFLAVQSRLKKIKGPILCLVGPPGVGTQQQTLKYSSFELILQAGVCCGPCNPSKWEARI